MRAVHLKQRNILNISKKFMAGGGKKKKIDPNLKDYDVVFVGGLNAANMIKYFQHKHFHGTMAGFCSRVKFSMEHLYDYLISGNTQPYKYLAMPFSSNYEVNESRCGRERIVQINPEKNQVITEKGDVFNYKALVLNTGLDQVAVNMPFVNKLIQDDYAKTRVFVQETWNGFQVNRNNRIFFMHKDGDFLLYLPKLPSKREAYDQWHLMLESYFARGLFLESRPRSMRIRVITPNNELLKFPFANEVVLDEIEQRGTIGIELFYNFRCSLWNGISRY